MKAIFAVNAWDGFAVGNTMPWPRNAVDLKRFRTLTTGGTVIMGRATWDSDMPKPLPNRKNVVLSKTLVDSRCTVCATIEQLLEEVKDDKNVWVIGGVQTLWALQSHIHAVYMTQFAYTAAADITLDTSKYLEDFELVDKEFHPDHTFKIYRRIP